MLRESSRERPKFALLRSLPSVGEDFGKPQEWDGNIDRDIYCCCDLEGPEDAVGAGLGSTIKLLIESGSSFYIILLEFLREPFYEWSIL